MAAYCSTYRSTSPGFTIIVEGGGMILTVIDDRLRDGESFAEQLERFKKEARLELKLGRLEAERVERMRMAIASRPSAPGMPLRPRPWRRRTSSPSMRYRVTR